MNRMMVLIAESGALYPLAMLASIMVFTIDENLDDLVMLLAPVLTVIVGIAPTMIMVRVDLGISIENNISIATCDTTTGERRILVDPETQPPLDAQNNLEIPRPFPLPSLQRHQTGPIAHFFLNPPPQKYRGIQDRYVPIQIPLLRYQYIITCLRNIASRDRHSPSLTAGFSPLPLKYRSER
ncbi:hypothetical protein D9757_005005 [Collybiopsis confluens]|uniref:Uncharacterized protein n=1 Tax=Collybiopsis confluens TaxID=2823264 RepID=A0A8H5HTC9_9AGAR|nr:hypothetical protein D9757_005005 [Collybiopsis confluens]